MEFLIGFQELEEPGGIGVQEILPQAVIAFGHPLSPAKIPQDPLMGLELGACFTDRMAEPG